MDKKTCLEQCIQFFIEEDKKLSEDMLIDTMINDGLTDSFNNYHMGVTAENIANKYKISRDEQDQFALYSQVKAQKAIMKINLLKK